jgi:predicted permease
MSRRDDDLNEEIRRHLEMAAQDRGKDAARREFGNATLIRELTRETWAWIWLERLVQDARYGLRGMRRSPAFAATTILSLAFAIAANTAIYSIFDASILRPLPVPDPDQLVMLSSPQILGPGEQSSHPDEAFSYPIYQQLLKATGDSARLVLFSYLGAALTEVQIPNGDAPIEHAMRQFVSGDAFDMLRVPPALGRVFNGDEDRVPGADPLAVISYDYWTRRFDGDPHVLGERLQMAGKSYEIIGVARKGFFGIEPGKFVDIWLPSMMYSQPAFANPVWKWFRVIGRLSPHVSPAQLQARLQPVFRSWQEERIRQVPSMPPAIQNQFREATIGVSRAANGPSAFRDDFARSIWIVFGISAATLLIACANLISLLLARSHARAVEMAMRVSLGAPRSRLIRQLLTESLLLSAAAGILGWGVARPAIPMLVRLLSTESNPVRFALAMDSRGLFFSTLISTIAAVCFGLIPAWQVSGERPVLSPRKAEFRAGRLRIGRGFVALQVAFAFCLILGGASFLFTLRNLLAVNPGFDPRNVTVITLSTSGLSDMTQKEQLNVLLDEFQRRVEARPGIQSAATAQSPLFRVYGVFPVILPGRRIAEQEEIFASASPRYFATLRTPLPAGRDFEQHDRLYSNRGPQPVIVNQAFARRYFPEENPVGKLFQSPNYGGPGGMVDREIIGVVANSAYGSVRAGPQPIVYSVVRGTNLFALYVRSPLDLGAVVKLVDEQARAIGYGTRIREVTTLEALIGDTLLREKLLAGIGGSFAMLGLLLSAIGLFGVLQYAVTRRTKEIGIRAALGAPRSRLVRLVVRDVGTMITGGLIMGLGASVALLTGIRSVLFGVRPADLGVIVTATAVFLAIALIAAGLPARRAATIDPAVALRHE